MTQRVRSWFGVVAALGLVVLGPRPAFSQVGAFGWSPDTARLTDEDMRMLWEGTVALNRSLDAAAGESRAWTNAISGNSGKVTLTKVFDSGGMQCHALQYALSFAGQPVPQNYNFNWCRTPGGQWKIAS